MEWLLFFAGVLLGMMIWGKATAREYRRQMNEINGWRCKLVEAQQKLIDDQARWECERIRRQEVKDAEH